MKSLQSILKGIKSVEISGDATCRVSGIAFDTRVVEKGNVFVAIKGTHVDGHDFIDKAIESGAGVIVCEHFKEGKYSGITFVKVKDSGEALGMVASNWYDNPSAELKLVGITGTNGKTTTVTLLFNLFRELGYRVGLVSTIHNKIDDKIIPTTHTTPDALALNKLLAEMVEKSCEYCFMEVSSHAMVQKRVAGITFTGGLFSNLTHDHLDFHKSFEEYLRAKKSFFDQLPEDAFALVNIDDKNGRVMLQNTKALQKTYSLRTMADFKGRLIESRLDSTLIEINGQETWCRLVGVFNCYNLLVAYGTAVLLGEDPLQVLTILSNLQAAEGRFDTVKSPTGVIGIIDYAHTPDALQNVLETIEQLRTGNESLITVVGCGGDRDAAKRPVMAGIACKGSNRVIITSDNPRTEDPQSIINEMMAGVGKEYARQVLVIADRREAIRTAYALANPGDVILIAGKGHEKYQEIKGVRYPFDDKQILADNF